MNKTLSQVVWDWFFGSIITKITEMETNIMSALDDKTQAIVDAVSKLGTDLAKAIADLKAQAGQATPDQLAKLDAIAQSLQGLDAEAIAEGATPTPPPAA